MAENQNNEQVQDGNTGSEEMSKNNHMYDMVDVETAEKLGYLNHPKVKKSVEQEAKVEIPLVCTKKEARDYMKSLPADKARRVGAIALLRGTAIKRQYDTMKRLAYGLSALLVASAATSWYLLYQQQKQADSYDALLQQTVSALPTEHVQYARAVYAHSVIENMKKNPQISVSEATQIAVQGIEMKNNTILPALKRVISHDVLEIAKAYEDMDVSKENYQNVMVGYAKGVVNSYANHTTPQETVRNNVLYYLQRAHMR